MVTRSNSEMNGIMTTGKLYKERQRRKSTTMNQKMVSIMLQSQQSQKKIQKNLNLKV